MGFPTASGPVLFEVGPGLLSGAELAAATTADAYVWQWPADFMVEGVGFFPSSGAAADAAALFLRVTDEDGEDLFQSDSLDNELPALLMSGPPNLHGHQNVRPFPLQRAVRAGDRWRFTVRNASAAPLTPVVVLYISNQG